MNVLSIGEPGKKIVMIRFRDVSFIEQDGATIRLTFANGLTHEIKLENSESATRAFNEVVRGCAEA